MAHPEIYVESLVSLNSEVFNTDDMLVVVDIMNGVKCGGYGGCCIRRRYGGCHEGGSRGSDGGDDENGG
ncbi:hypothetical protein C5167_004639 [Papaver somniferum]|uniref:Uncharacterized protein n=1 Tax=Papaver somniferum TaxID=3469 RepID=A0A4Y7JBF4_PAPSO|nr:hypothetical protein C5167_004639 [Papaver somniferum]